MIPAAFDYHAPRSVADAIKLLGQLGPEAKLLAGGHSLLPMMKLRLATPEHLVDINDLTELSYIEQRGDLLAIGAMTRHRELLESALVGRLHPIVHDAEPTIADPVVRNRGTIGGALCQADPGEDLSAVCTALRAQAIIRGRDGERSVEMHDFHRGPYETAVADGEMLAQAEHIPVHLGSMPASVAAVIARFGVDPPSGVQFAVNDPFHGGTHLNDLTLLRPVHDGDRLIGWVANRAHHADVGGEAPGSMPAHATRLEQEGHVVAPVVAVVDGRWEDGDQKAPLGVRSGCRVGLMRCHGRSMPVTQRGDRRSPQP